MADKKISELDLALLINDDAEFPFSQDNAGEPTTFKGRITQLGTKIAEDMTFSNLRTTSKKLVGAINELLSLGSPIIIGTTAPTSSIGADGNIYVKYTAGTGGADDEVDGIYVKIDGAWCEISTGGGSGAGGHTIVDDDGTSLTQRTNLQFKGAYSEDNSTDDTTEVNVVREMTKAEFDLLSAAEKTGLINITDITGGNDDRFQPVVYSEDEREIGVWINGKPLYQKTGHLAENLSIANSWTNFVLSDPIDNIETIAQVIYNNGAPFGFSDGFVIFRSNNGNLQAQLKASSTSITFNANWVITFVYTKTTDQAGSGQWTPQGVPAHHYSTDEQVIGTWIDGSTIYEKTFTASFTNIPSETPQNVVDISGLGINEVISSVGVCKYSAENQSDLYESLGLHFYCYIYPSGYLQFAQTMTSQTTGRTYVLKITIQYTKTST